MTVYFAKHIQVVSAVLGWSYTYAKKGGVKTDLVSAK